MQIFISFLIWSVGVIIVLAIMTIWLQLRLREVSRKLKNLTDRLRSVADRLSESIGEE